MKIIIRKAMFEINGIKYQERPRNPREPLPKSVIPILGMAMAIGMVGKVGTSQSNGELNLHRIIEEYGLIQLKKSNLTKSQRDWVVREF
jgi:hypothetical protein